MMFQSVEEIYKVASISLSPGVPGQIFVSRSFYFVLSIYFFKIFWSLIFDTLFPLFIPLMRRYIFIFSSSFYS